MYVSTENAKVIALCGRVGGWVGGAPRPSQHFRQDINARLITVSENTACERVNICTLSSIMLRVQNKASGEVGMKGGMSGGVVKRLEGEWVER